MHHHKTLLRKVLLSVLMIVTLPAARATPTPIATHADSIIAELLNAIPSHVPAFINALEIDVSVTVDWRSGALRFNAAVSEGQINGALDAVAPSLGYPAENITLDLTGGNHATVTVIDPASGAAIDAQIVFGINGGGISASVIGLRVSGEPVPLSESVELVVTSDSVGVDSLNSAVNFPGMSYTIDALDADDTSVSLSVTITFAPDEN